MEIIRIFLLQKHGFDFRDMNIINIYFLNFEELFEKKKIVNSLLLKSTFLYISQEWKLLSHVQLFATPWIIESMEFSMPEYWSG